jgi:hypothetical protein
MGCRRWESVEAWVGYDAMAGVRAIDSDRLDDELAVLRAMGCRSNRQQRYRQDCQKKKDT